jgi:sulfite reductase alpha subunit-like flavoprotein
MKRSFSLWHKNTTVRVEVSRIELLQDNPTFRISVDGEFIGYVERLSPRHYSTISSEAIPKEILEHSVEFIETTFCNN